MKNTLIIKTGISETFAESLVPGSSLGDVLRTTVILHLFAGDRVTWVTSKPALPLLRGIPGIERLWSEEDFVTLEHRAYDTVINLEREEKWCRRTQAISSADKRGFLSAKGDLVAAPVLGRQESWQQGLFRLLGCEWKGEEYRIGPRAGARVEYDVGLNWAVGRRWPTKVWPRQKWELLAQVLAARHSVSWQQGFDNLDEYMDWVWSCKSLVTTDSLGLHLALAFRKPVVALFGPTSQVECFLYGRGEALVPDPARFECAPCRSAKCVNQVHCMSELSVEDLFSRYNLLLGRVNG